MEQNILQQLTSQLHAGLDDAQAAQTVLDSLDKLHLEDSTEIGDQLLAAIGARPGIVINLLQLIINQNLLEEYWNFLLQVIEQLPESDGRQSLENAVLDLWLSPHDAKSYANLGLALAAINQPAFAESAYNRAAELDQDSSNTYNDRGVLYYNQGKHELALKDYTRALEIDPNDLVTLKNTIIVLGDLNRFEEAGEFLARYLRHNPNDVWAIHERGRVKAESGRYEQAIADYDLSLSLDDSYKWAYLNKGSALINMERYEEALDPLNKAITLDPYNTRALHERGRAFSLMNRYAEALEDYDRVIALDPQHKWAYANKAYALRELERFSESEAIFRTVLELDPGYVWARKEFGVLFEKIGKPEQAIQEYDQALAVDPEYKYAYANKGGVLRSLKRYDAALEALTKAIRIDNQYKWAVHERGLAHFNCNRYEDAIQDFERVVALDPDYKWAFANLGKSHWALKRFEDAEKAFQSALIIDPNYIWVLRERADLYLAQGKYQDALDDLSSTVPAEAATAAEYLDRARSLQKMGVVLEKDGRYEERQDILRKARTDLEEAGKLEPGNPDTLWYLGVVWHDMYGYDQAEEIYLKAIAHHKDPESEDVAILWWNIGKSRNQRGLIVKDSIIQQKSIDALAIPKKNLKDPVQRAECFSDIGLAYLALEKYAEAVESLSQARSLDPMNAQLIFLVGKAQYLMQDISRAEDTFAALLKLEPTLNAFIPHGWVGRGLCAEAREETIEAEEAFQQALGDNSEPARALLNRADAFEGLLAFDHSADDLEQAILLDPANANAFNSLAWLYIEKLGTPANLKRAIECGEQAIEAQVDAFWRGNFLDTLSWAHYKAGNLQGAEKYIDEALTNLPEPFEIRYHQEKIKAALNSQDRVG